MWILTSTDGDLDEPAEEEDTHRVGQRDESQELFTKWTTLMIYTQIAMSGKDESFQIQGRNHTTATCYYLFLKTLWRICNI